MMLRGGLVILLPFQVRVGRVSHFFLRTRLFKAVSSDMHDGPRAPEMALAETSPHALRAYTRIAHSVLFPTVLGCQRVMCRAGLTPEPCGVMHI